MDYKNTLNLPQTGFPMKADLVAREPERLKRWTDSNLYHQIQDARADGDFFLLHDGPPFANGDVHVGTALNKILKDFVVKYHTMRGRRAPYVPGWDCHGLPIEFKVSQEMRKAGDTASDPATIRRACHEYATKFINLQREQFKRLGVLGDWDNPYLTYNPQYEADELRLLADIVEKGFVYRGKKPVYWSIPCRTALAEAEVEYTDHVSPSIFVKFPIVGSPDAFIVIWTTTPWTLPANLAVAFNSTFTYSQVRVGNETFLISTLLVGKVAEKAGWESYEIIRNYDGSELLELEYRHPFCDRKGKLFPGDSFVENTTGTGFVHIAPGHGLEDYMLGLQQKLPIYSPVNDDGALDYTNDLPVEQQMPAELRGKSILEKAGKSEANEGVLDILKRANALLAHEPYSHSYPFCWRSKTPVIFRAMNQWFIKIDHLNFRTAALQSIDEVSWIPEWGKNRIESAVKSRPDWCISRQRTWGVPIPAFYTADGIPILNAQIIRKTADLFEKEGSNSWFEKPLPELWSLVKPEGWSEPDPVAKSHDTLDVWIDSGSSSRAVIMRHPALRQKTVSGENRWQADMYLEGSDQHRGWFQSSLLLSLAGNGAPPYKTVLTHGFMVDADREKISKSKQTGYQKPQTAEAYVKQYGADILRLWVASQDYRNDIVVSEERLNKVAEMYRTIRNTLRYQLSNLYDFDPAKDTVSDDQLTGLDRWILRKFAALKDEVLVAYDRYEFHLVYQRISQFVAVELSAVYHDTVKDRLYTYAAHSKARRSTQTALYALCSGFCELLAPILAFTADEAWEFLPGKKNSVHLSKIASADLARASEEQETWKALFTAREAALPVLEKSRQAKEIGKSLEARVIASGNSNLLKPLQENAEAFRELLNVSQLEIKEAQGDLTFLVQKAEGQKCGRCWHLRNDIGINPAHPTICGRCVEAVETSRAKATVPEAKLGAS